MIRLLTLFVFFSTLHPAAADPLALGQLSAASATAEQAKDYAAAIRHMEAFAQRGGEPFYAALRLGWLHYCSGDYPAAQRRYTEATMLQPGSINARLGVLNTATALKDARRTAQAAAAVLKTDPNNYQSLMALAGLQFGQRNYREAAAAYTRILEKFPDDSDALSGAAWSALRLGDKARALTDFALLLGRNPAYPKAQEGYQQASL